MAPAITSAWAWAPRECAECWRTSQGAQQIGADPPRAPIRDKPDFLWAEAAGTRPGCLTPQSQNVPSLFSLREWNMPDDQGTITVITDQEIDAVLCEAKGDAREAIRMLLHDLAVLAADAERLVSKGFVRNRAPWKRIG